MALNKPLNFIIRRTHTQNPTANIVSSNKLRHDLIKPIDGANV